MISCWLKPPLQGALKGHRTMCRHDKLWAGFPPHMHIAHFWAAVVLSNLGVHTFRFIVQVGSTSSAAPTLRHRAMCSGVLATGSMLVSIDSGAMM